MELKLIWNALSCDPTSRNLGLFDNSHRHLLLIFMNDRRIFLGIMKGFHSQKVQEVILFDQCLCLSCVMNEC